ncbi:MAG: hypothetical protein HY744_14265 [Deltaproteobacteria bacterium]|nr:hypothetical protein [Deltaproteobacteria bacterium]
MHLPPQLASERTVLFDDVRLESIEPERHADFVIARVLERGTLDSVVALVGYYGRDRIRRFFLDGGALQLSRRTVPLWAALLELPADSCTPRSSPRRRSPYWSD